MITTSRKVINTSCGVLAALAILATSVAPASAHATRHYHHHNAKPHVNVKVNLGGNGGHHYAYRPAPVVYVAPPKRRCTRVRRDGWYRGYPALVSNRVCFNVYGDPIVQSGTKRLVHYY